MRKVIIGLYCMATVIPRVSAMFSSPFGSLPSVHRRAGVTRSYKDVALRNRLLLIAYCFDVHVVINSQTREELAKCFMSVSATSGPR